MAGYNRTRFVEELLERTENSSPSFTVHLHSEYWTLNQGSKFLYNNQIASLLDDIRAHRIPVDFLDLFEAAKVPFYDGCMIVELLDYRPQRNKEHIPEKPERTRAVLHPNSETLWADICSLNQRSGGKWTDNDALAVEARLLLAISPPLCLDPDPHLTRMANHVLRVSTPTVPVSLKRKAAAMDPEEDETDKARRAKIMQFMTPQTTRTHAPSYRILDAIQNARQASAKPPTPLPTNQYLTNPPQQSPTKPPTSAQSFSHAQSPVESEDKRDIKTAKTTNTPKITFAAPNFPRPNGSQTPVPPQTTHFINHLQVPNGNATPPPHTRSPMQPQVYPNVQAATDSAKRTPTPVQRQRFSQSPRPPSSQAHAASQPAPQPSGSNQLSTPAFQPAIPNQQFLNAPPAGRNVASKPPANSVQMPPQMPGVYSNAQMTLTQQHQAAAYLRMNAQKNGRATPQAGQPASAAAARNSPMMMNRPIAARSPMPPNTQPPQQKHPPQHPQAVFTLPYNPAQLRPMIHGNPSPHPQGMPAHLTHGAAGTPPNASTPQDGQQQPQMHTFTPTMYGYSAVNFGPMAGVPGRMNPAMAAGYWQLGMGRGMPMTEQPMPRMTATPPQMPAGKTGLPGIPGR